MSMMPAVFSDKWFDDFFDFPMSREFRRLTPSTRQMAHMMKTDVRENENGYELDIDLPGFKKEDIQIVAEDGYLTVSASQKEEVNEENSRQYIRRERYTGSCSRSFYIGEDVKDTEISARFEDGILKLDIPKLIKNPEENRKFISIQ